jgi:pyruvate dehydrogenase E1 component
VEKQENVFYYLTLLNENYAQPGLRTGTEAEIIQGMYLLKEGNTIVNPELNVNLLGSGSILRESIAAQQLLADDWGVGAHIWSCPSFSELAREGQEIERWNTLHPEQAPRTPFVTRQLGQKTGPVVASTDYVRAYTEQIRPYMPKGRSYKTLGTDGFGRSDFRFRLRHHFEIDRYYITVTALKALQEEGKLSAATVAQAIAKYNIDADKTYPLHA